MTNFEAAALFAAALVGMIAARRIDNKDTDAGYGIAGWGVFFLFLLLAR